MPRITIDLSEEEMSDLEKRGEDNYLSLKEQVEEIVRRSLISWNARRKRGYRPIKTDDKLVGIFSRQKSGRKRK